MKVDLVFRLGLIGSGKWGRKYIGAVKTVPGVQLTAVASTNPQTQGLLPHHCELFSDWRNLLTSGKVDGVVIATPPQIHFEQAMFALRNGIRALVEKPLTLHLHEAETLRDESFGKSVPLLPGYTQLFNRGYLALKKELAILGKIKHILSEGGNRGPFRDYSGLWDYGPHDLAHCMDLAQTLPISFSAQQEGGNGVVSLEFPSGITATAKFGNHFLEKKRKLTVTFENGSIAVVNDLIDEKLVIDQRPVACPGPTPLEKIVETFSTMKLVDSHWDTSLKITQILETFNR